MQKHLISSFPIVFVPVAALTGRRDGTHAASEFEKAARRAQADLLPAEYDRSVAVAEAARLTGRR